MTPLSRQHTPTIYSSPMGRQLIVDLLPIASEYITAKDDEALGTWLRLTRAVTGLPMHSRTPWGALRMAESGFRYAFRNSDRLQSFARRALNKTTSGHGSAVAASYSAGAHKRLAMGRRHSSAIASIPTIGGNIAPPRYEVQGADGDQD